MTELLAFAERNPIASFLILFVLVGMVESVASSIGKGLGRR